jgi:hypothetical protein
LALDKPDVLRIVVCRISSQQVFCGQQFLQLSVFQYAFGRVCVDAVFDQAAVKHKRLVEDRRQVFIGYLHLSYDNPLSLRQIYLPLCWFSFRIGSIFVDLNASSISA